MDPVDSLTYKVIFDAPYNHNYKLDLMQWPAWSKELQSKVPKDLPCRFCHSGIVYATNNETIYMQLLANGGRAFYGKTLQINTDWW
jgi:hypothetical protein